MLKISSNLLPTYFANKKIKKWRIVIDVKVKEKKKSKKMLISLAFVAIYS